MDVEEEYEEYLSDNTKLQELGQADAKAIAEYLGLKKINLAETAAAVNSGSAER